MYQSSLCFLWPSPLLEPNREISCSQPELLLNIVLFSGMKKVGPHKKNLYRVVEQYQQGVQIGGSSSPNNDRNKGSGL